MKPFLIRHLEGENLGRFPAWMMRQAGRYLPSYLEIRKQHSFWQMVTMPDVATKVSLLPLEVLPVDAIIFFSDILTPPYGLGIEIEMREGIGPFLPKPLRAAQDFEKFREFSAENVAFVTETLQRIRAELPQDKALIGFAGAPWTLACYLVEGRSTKNFEHAMSWLHRDPEGFAQVLATLGEMTVKYLNYQVKAGAQIVQLFDTWASEMPKWFYVSYYQKILNRIFEGVPSVPRIYFAKHSQHLWEEFQNLKCQVLSCDALLGLTEFEKLSGGKFSLQGNLEPTVLFCGTEVVEKKTRSLVAEARKLKKPAIINLGHGVLPKTPVENVKTFFREAQKPWD